jgi:predicted alpha-1,2-mannosidase
MIMRKIKWVLYNFLIIWPVFTKAQINQIHTLVEAQELRTQYIGAIQNTSDKISKSLYVNPFIGTGGHGHTYPGASMPFGMMQLSPDTRYEGWDGCSGYHYSDSIIYGFSHTHLSGTGVPDYCDLLLVPQSGKPKINPGYSDKKGYGSKFHHAQERATPGFYEVYLEDEEINVRLTVSERSGMHEYTFLGEGKEKYVLIDLDHRDQLIKADLEVIDNQTIQGFRISESWAKEQHFYFYLNTSISFENAKLINDKGRHKLLLKFPSNTSSLLIKVGISAVDQNGAKNNLEKEIPDWNFNAVRANASKKWNDELNKIDYSATEDQMITFYSALYHSFLNPNIFSDVDGRYRGRDNNIYKLDKGTDQQYTVFSLWDTFRATHPLFTLVQQKRTAEFVNTFMRHYLHGFDLPVWELAANETECMIGYHSVSVMSDAYSKGLSNANSEETFKAMTYTANLNEFGKNENYANGFISLNEEPESVSKTLEYAYDDFCIAQFAKFSGFKAVEKEYLKRSMNFINLFDPTTKFMRARRSGQWISSFDPSEVNFNYTEANSWQYSLYTPHAVGVLVSLLGGKDSLESWLDRLFTTSNSLTGREQVDITGLIGQYAHGNEPSHHMAYLYNYTNAPYKTQLYVDRILKTMYSNQPDGLSGNEDCGQMSSWYCLSAMGLYQLAPGNPFYEFGRPIMNEATLKLENDKQLNIKTINNCDTCFYMDSIVFNNNQLFQSYISHDQLMSGGNLTFYMSGIQSNYNAVPVHAPTIDKAPDNFVAVPYFEQTESLFDDSLIVTLNYPKFPTDLKDFKLFYSLDSLNWAPYRSNILINKSCKVFAYVSAIRSDGTSIQSPVVSGSFQKIDHNVHLNLLSPYENQYAAAGTNTLIDGIRGGNEFRTGDWQGFYGKNIIAEVTFDEPRAIKEIGLSCLMDLKSWIFLPNQIKISYSLDGINFKNLDPIFTNYKFASNVMSPTSIPSFSSYVSSGNYEFYRTLDDIINIKKIKIEAVNYGKCPEWHLGNGNDTWLFADEIIFR